VTVVEAVTHMSEDLVAAVARLMPQLSASAAVPTAADLEELTASSASTLFVARLSPPGTIVGMLTLVLYRIPTGLNAVIEDVVVDEDARGSGAGAALVRAALEEAERRGARHVDLTSRPSREAANRLYARLGFEQRATNVYRFTRH
jgi:ribosomal protein S18 acetylase RimI-like enzyme